MINQASVDAVNSSGFSHSFRKPLYGTYCFSRIPQLIEYVLTGEGEPGLPMDVLGDLPNRYNKVILLYVDAFGWKFFEKYADKYPFLKRFLDQGVVSKITAQFPSTTAAHVTSIHLGVPVGESGIYEWFYYEPLLDRMIAPLMFSYAGDEERGTIKFPPGLSLKPFFPYQTVYERLKDRGIKSYVVQHTDYVNSTFGNTALAGANLMPYKTLPEALINLADAVTSEQDKAYFFLYFDPIDAIGHRYGPSSKHFEAEIENFMLAAERLLHTQLADGTQDTLLLITADHGQDDVSPDTTIYLNLEIPEILQFLRKDGEGRLLAPAGSPRDLFLYIKEENLDEAYNLLANHPVLKDRAEVRRVSELIEQGFFGPTPPSERFLQRVANLVILGQAGETIWWYEKGRYEQHFYGHHGGLTPQEMEIPLLALAYP